MAQTTVQPIRTYSRYRQDKKRLIAVAVRVATRASESGNYRQLVTALAILQLLMARRALEAVVEQLEEQAIEAPAAASVIAEAFAGISQLGIPLPERVEFARTAAGDTAANVLRMVLTEVNDTARVVTGVDITTRPGLAGYVRYLNPPSCARCAILAGRIYHTAEVFDRHDNCDCDMIAVENIDDVPDWAIFDPMDAFRKGQIDGLSKADTKAIRDGADMAQVVNVRRKAAGLSAAGNVVERGGRLTPEGIYQLASDRQDALDMLLKFGYIR